MAIQYRKKQIESSLSAEQPYSKSNVTSINKQYREYVRRKRFYEKQAKISRLKQRFSNVEYSQRFGGKVSSFIDLLAQVRRRQKLYAQEIGVGGTRSAFVSLRGQYGKKGRPPGPSGRYYIPGVGPVGVYEFRRYLSSQITQRKIAFQRNASMSPLALARERAIQMQQQSPENQIIPDTRGSVPLRSLHKEADDYANLFP